MPPSTNLDLKKIANSLRTNIEDIVLLGIFALNECSDKRGKKANLQFARRAIRLGAKTLAEKEKSVPFSQAVEESLKAKAHRRAITLYEIRRFMNKLITTNTGLGERLISTLSPSDCQKAIAKAFHTDRQRHKARTLLHGIFALAWKRGWCTENPVAKVDIPSIQEKMIEPLNISETKELIHKAQEDEHRECLIPISIMMYAGVRPHEVQRLTWQNINLEEGTLTLTSQQTKTGGARQITLEPVLLNLLRKEHHTLGQNVIIEETDSDNSPRKNPKPLCPPNWIKKWRRLRQDLGWHPLGEKQKHWTPDVLRHTYASYHALYYKDYQRLQYEMGHRSSQLLRTRYLNLQGLTQNHAQSFWEQQN